MHSTLRIDPTQTLNHADHVNTGNAIHSTPRGKTGLLPRALLILLVTVTAVTGRAADEGPLPPVPGAYSVSVDYDVMVPMRDGVRLATDMYYPTEAGGKLPAIMIRLPYSKDKEYAVEAARYFASHGYRVLVQDMRGKWKSEGDYLVSAADRKDGYDFIDWIIRQPWSAGVVGSYGCSYLGENQIMLAAEKHPAHRAMIAQAAGGAVGKAGGSYRYFGTFEGGVFGLAGSFGWFPHGGTKDKTDDQVFPEDVSAALWGLPTIELMDRHGIGPTDWRDFISRDLADTWWDDLGYITDKDTFDVPTLHVNSWYDYGVSETFFLWRRFQEHALSDRARNGQYVIISPVTHCRSERATAHTVVGEVDVGDARLPYWDIYLDWFDHWLKGAENGVARMPRIRYFMVGEGQWRQAQHWPPATAGRETLYLHSGGRANSSSGDGKLLGTMPGEQSADTFIYDPANPVPSRGGSVCCTGNPEDQPGIYDQSDIEMREDVLVYTSGPYVDGLDLVGPLEGVLHVGSFARDTDFTLKLVDVHPDGTAHNIQDAILRARYREGFDKKVWMKPGEVYRLAIDLHDTAYRLRPGHRLRLEVSSSNFPRFERNLNTGGNNYDETRWVSAENRVYHSERYPSYLRISIKK